MCPASSRSRKLSTLWLRWKKARARETRLTDGMKIFAAAQAFHAARFDGRSHDKLGSLAENAGYALERLELRKRFLAELRRLRI
jgi:UTP-glucose-1-phosphate uridylyltransferase